MIGRNGVSKEAERSVIAHPRPLPREFADRLAQADTLIRWSMLSGSSLGIDDVLEPGLQPDEVSPIAPRQHRDAPAVSCTLVNSILIKLRYLSAMRRLVGDNYR
jgi:hypothetical protein